MVELKDAPMYVKNCTTHHFACDCREWIQQNKIQQLEAENKKLRECVEFYRDFKNRNNGDGDGGYHDISHRARQCLAELDKE